ncbi:hypothetical protein BV25DRAFT_1823084 [Artomyces pyxidatus]|uniref:Uncharacterized protein n=1 Tax=Artomyces pyxidatus TaxID=48021 RepID=A0ACB8T935_9AGAM|nr:hypothetical protein BV25DRAFT_1823084 [Artomyces pyxidatus]
MSFPTTRNSPSTSHFAQPTDDSSDFNSLADGRDFDFDVEFDQKSLTVSARLRTTLTPIHGAYVVFTLDPVATLEALEDPIAMEQAKRLHTRKYVGCLVQHMDLPSPLRTYTKCTCIFLSQGLPQASEVDGIEESMCVPIIPAVHPTDREGVTISPSLPWNNLYHHTRLAQNLRLKPKDGDYNASPLLSEDDLWHLNMSFHTDTDRCRELKQIYKSAHPSLQSLSVLPPTLDRDITSVTKDTSLAHGPPQPRNPSLELYEAPVASSTLLESSGKLNVSSCCPRESEDPVIPTPIASSHGAPEDLAVDHGSSLGSGSSLEGCYDFDADDALALAMGEMMMGYEDPKDRFLPVAEFSLDLSVYMLEEIAAIKQIQIESEQRSRAAMELLEKERVGKWARGISEHGSVCDKPTLSTPILNLNADSESTAVAARHRQKLWTRWGARCTTTNIFKCPSPSRAVPCQKNSSPLSRLLSIFTFGCIPHVSRTVPTAPASDDGFLVEKGALRP